MSDVTIASGSVDTPPHRGRPAGTISPIPFARILWIELRKMFDTRSGLWLMASILIVAALATVGTLILVPESDLTYESFLSAIGFPMNTILPLVAILSVTSEWGQRTALTTFTLVPSRARVISAKAGLCAIIGVSALAVAAVLGAVGNIGAAAFAGVGATWDVGWQGLVLFAMANVIGMGIGFMLAVLTRSSPAAVVAFFVYYLVVPIVSTAVAGVQEWYADHVHWIDFNTNVNRLFGAGFTGDDALSAQQWFQLGLTGLVWLVVPLTVGLRLALRAEIK
ncbi:ABC-2 family transporter [Haloactinopolyspora alba]|uniref:ABC-2 family transporter n=1 Tax=Haloactinopolyspora alba TaxID=648780 RepID=A0A2P8DY61_9ACTN|nr:ABC transporter permease subunit [Haloactinopolyspora alba]PSL02123.1 ABC-2 family transporter [Haloactinopolyspora alba]